MEKYYYIVLQHHYLGVKEYTRTLIKPKRSIGPYWTFIQAWQVILKWKGIIHDKETYSSSF